MNEQYPVQFSVEYPDRPLNRLTTFFRIFTAIPILIVLGTLVGYSWGYWDAPPDAERELGRGMPLVKWLLAIPHYFVLFFLHIAVLFVVVFVWFAILFTGPLPAGAIRVRRGGVPVGQPGQRVRLPARDGQVPALPARAVT
jgi:hypothetical protein